MKLIPTVLSLSLRHVGCGVGALLALTGGGAQALSLQQAYDAALQNDPQYRMGFYDSESGKEFRVIGRSGLLPQLQGSYSTSRNIVDQTTQSGRAESFTQPRYISRAAVVQVRQTLFSLDAMARYRQGVAQSKAALARFEFSNTDVILRTVSAYSDAMFTKDQLKLAEAQRNTLLEHIKVAKWLMDKGEGTKTDVLEIESRLALAEAQVIENQDAVKAALDALEGVVGMPVDRIDDLSADFRVLPEPQSFDDWRTIALENNPELKAYRMTVEVQQQEVKKAYAGHTPRLDFVGSYSHNDADSISTYQQSTVNRQVGIQLTVPLYSGGQVSAVSRQAVANRERARAELDLHTSKVLVELRKAHALVLSSASKVEALERAVESGVMLIKATEQSIKGGVRINLDLLNAQQQLATSQRDLAQARYGYLLGVVRMKSAAGTLNGGDVHDMARFFR